MSGPDRRADVVAALALVAVAAGRFATLTDRDAPATIDGGNWLALGHALLDGPSVRSGEIVYPPVVPLVATAATGALGPVTAMGLLAALASIAPAAGVYVVLRRTAPGAPAVAFTLLVALAAAVGEAAAWGGLPQLLAGGALPPFALALDRTLARPERRATSVAAGLIALIALTSHLVTAVAVGVGLSLVVLHLPPATVTTTGRWGPAVRRRVLPLAVVATAAALASAPSLGVWAAVGAHRPEPGATATVGWTTLPAALGRVHADAPLLGLALLGATALAAATAVRCGRPPGMRPGLALLATIGAGVLVTREERLLGLVPLATALLCAPAVPGWVDGRPGRRALATAVLVVAVSVQVGAAVTHFPDQRDHYGVVDPGTFAALDWLRRETPPDTVVGVSTVDDAPLGWWVEGWSRRPAVYASSLRWLAFADERARARQANAVFGPRFPGAVSMGRARAAGVDVLLVAKRSDRWVGSDVDRFVACHPGTVLYENADAVVLDVPATDRCR